MYSLPQSYNQTSRFKRGIYSNAYTYEGGDTYLLPSKELASKYIAIGAYNGSISMKHLSDIIGKDAYEEYKTQIDYCVHDGLLMNVDDKLVITRKGFEHYGAIFSLFYSKMEA